MDAVPIEGTVKSFNKILTSMATEKMEGLKVVRVPFLEEKAVPLECFDIIVSALRVR